MRPRKTSGLGPFRPPGGIQEYSDGVKCVSIVLPVHKRTWTFATTTAHSSTVYAHLTLGTRRISWPSVESTLLPSYKS